MTETEDLFKETFKKYRKTVDSHIFDIENNCSINGVNVNKIEIESKCHSTPFGLISPQKWIVYKFDFPSGLIFIKNPFTPEGQRYWISQCLTEYPSPPHITNILNLNTKLKKPTDTKIDICNEDNEKIYENDKFFRKLRWITFGYHHNWDTKVYEESSKCDFPLDLKGLTKHMANVLGFEDFAAEAAIVNYYHLDSTLSGHVDKSEENKEAPLFSISFGQTAIFLIGGSEKSTKPLSLYLRSGDVVIMAGRSRASYHAVPRIIKTNEEPWNDLPSSIRCKKAKREETLDCDCKDSPINFNSNVFQQVISKWSSFSQHYISESRINLNVRQVLLPGTSKLQKQND